MPSELENAALRFRAQVLANERQAATEMVRVYGQAWQRTRTELTALQRSINAARAAGMVPDTFVPRQPGGPVVLRTPGTFSPAWLYQEDRYQSLMRQIEQEMRTFGQYADGLVTAGQQYAIEAGVEHSTGMVTATAGPEVRAVFNQLPRAAVQDLVGYASDGSPLRALFDALGPEVSQGIRDALTTALATGMNPRETARLVRRRFGMGLVRALRISRTEQLRAYREATRRNYEANSDVVEGWQWLCACDRRSCASCWAMHGSRHTNKETLDDHIQGRCVMLPIVVGFKPTIQRTGSELFAELPEVDQQAILGKAAHLAYQDGAVELKDFVGRRNDPDWGTMRYAKSLRQVLGSDGANKYISKVMAKTLKTPSTRLPRQYQPIGEKVSEKFTGLPKKGAMVEPLRATLDAIDSVHGDGPLPDLPVRISAGERRVGGYTHQVRPFKSIEISISRKGTHQANTFAHEIGHFLDYEQLNVNNASSTDVAVQNWQKAVMDSRAAKRIADLRDRKAKLVYNWGESYADRKYCKYLYQHNELWARSYAQYIAARSKNPIMLKELDAVRKANGDAYPTQWDDDDFGPIADAIDALFVAKGWLK